MKLIQFLPVLLVVLVLTGCKQEKSNKDLASAKQLAQNEDNVRVIPIKHGTLILETSNEVIYIDPTGGSEAFANQNKPTLVLITDIHGDHLSKSTLEALNLSNTTIVGPKAVTDKIPSTLSKTIATINNGDQYKHNAITIEAIPMYNIREEALKFHTKGRGNGYVLTINEERIYISGDTEDIPEMRNLNNIDKAFVCMNLPYTMTVESAADAVLTFKPKTVYPYHYRGTNGLSDVGLFKKLINEKDKDIQVRLLDWY
ncbi:MAG: MBL fold metallo-hydrolase [Winogradskyella sp.]|uniref:MBL fold metallo-hydrolase n=1 Tax=Winogradskyella sp. TaxID=1883156 RepID=UPI0025DB95C1|nr:MBL fold metallo-hydrolase [Winogradskyella sp.]NRB84194.1 MBL fold metallo-hydrolase [Winogradskyella sp.]